MKKAVLLCWMTLIILSNNDSHAICVALCTGKAAGGINRARSPHTKKKTKKKKKKKEEEKRFNICFITVILLLSREVWEWERVGKHDLVLGF